MEHGPYNGYLAQVTVDYFTQTPPEAEQQHGLRLTHNAVFDGMSPQLRAAVDPYMNDIVRWPHLLAELKRATLGAWGNYVGDQYELGRTGELPSTEDRREVAVRSGLTMGFLGVIEASAEVDPAERTAEHVAGFFARVTHSLMTGEVEAGAVLPEVDDKGRASEQASHDTVAQHLAAFMHQRFGLQHDERLREGLREDMTALAELTDVQLRTHRSDEVGFFHVAEGLGKVSASMVLRHTEVRSPDDPYEVGRMVAEDLGELGGYIRHGTNILGALRAHLPTYATAILAKHGGATKAALTEITRTRNERAGKSLAFSSRMVEQHSVRQRGIIKMARHLLWIKEGFMRRRGTARQINEILRNDPFWQEWMKAPVPTES